MFYVEIEDDVIKNFCCGDYLPENAKEVPEFWNGITGEPLTFYDDDLNRKSKVQLVKEGLIEMPVGMKFNDDESAIIPMTDEELYEAGLKEIPKGFVFEDGKLREMTTEEKVEAGVITQKEADEIEIEELKAYLADTDYVTIKIMEGVSTEEDYADILAERKKARARINELESE